MIYYHHHDRGACASAVKRCSCQQCRCKWRSYGRFSVHLLLLGFAGSAAVFSVSHSSSNGSRTSIRACLLLLISLVVCSDPHCNYRSKSQAHRHQLMFVYVDQLPYLIALFSPYLMRSPVSKRKAHLQGFQVSLSLTSILTIKSNSRVI